MATNPYMDRAPYRAPDFALTIDGRDITPSIDARLDSLSLSECRGNESDQLDLVLNDSDGTVRLPPRGAEIALRMGWAGETLIDKGLFTVDEVEHSGSPDQVHIRARAADMRKSLRIRRDQSWHGTTLGDIVGAIAKRHDLQGRVDDALAGVKVAHIDQTGESDLHFLTRLATQYDAVATVKKDRLVFLPINGTRSSSGHALTRVTITRGDGDQHRFHISDRDAYSGVRAYWHDPGRARRRGVLVGKKGHEKRLKDTYGSQADAMAAARAEMNRIARGAATLELTLALGRPELMPQTPVTVRGFKSDIDGTSWLVVKTHHHLGEGGLTTRVELENGAVPDDDTAQEVEATGDSSSIGSDD